MLLKVPSKLPNVGMQADWIEASCLFGHDVTVTRSEVNVALESSTDYQEDEINSIIEDAFGEISRRGNILKEHPMKVDRNKIGRLASWEDTPAYSFMLLLATNHFYTRTRITNENRGTPAKLFEGLATAALNKYLPAAINIGWPRKGMPESLKECLELFSAISNEMMRGHPEIADYAKDEDVNIIAWSPIDSRSGQVMLLVQCTIEKDWRKSASKIDFETWRNIMNFATPPRKALAFPQVGGLSQWKYQSSKSGILFDRLRLAYLFPAASTTCLKRKILDWSLSQRSNLRWFN